MIQGITITDKEIAEAKGLVRKLYKNDAGEPFELTTGQAQIFSAIFKKKAHRLHVSTFTRFGKSSTIALAVLTRVTMFPEKFAIVAGNRDKANIIMGYIINHIFDGPLARSEFVMEPGESEESIRRYKNKSRINFKIGDLLGEVFVTTAAGALGFGASNVVCDEAALIPENEFVFVTRMLGDSTDNYLIKVGNPFESDHFRKSYEDQNYAKIIIDYVQGIREGRIKPAFVDEARQHPFFDVLYECKFPPQGQADEGNWVPLMTRSEVARAMIPHGSIEGFGIRKLGCDVAGGGRNLSVIAERYRNLARILWRSHTSDTMEVAEKILHIRRTAQPEMKIHRSNIAIDMVGIGRGCYDLLNREMPGIIGVNAGDKIPDNDPDSAIFFNLRAKMFWKLREWVLAGGRLEMIEGVSEENQPYYQLSKIKYRTRLEGAKGKIQIMPKDLMRSRDGTESPDEIDSIANTWAAPDFTTPDYPIANEGFSQATLNEMKIGRRFNRENPFSDNNNNDDEFHLNIG